ncbi:hypothetical protein H7X65_01025 [Candidatus Parcubacteria bacterium]|nr:hypothetical protein [Candidatus Parcubacteria bacterium]
MKNRNNKSKNIYTLAASTLVVLLVFSYIICIYKTVVLASDSEINNKKISVLTASINQKEFEYIGQVSSIDLDKALSLGYQKNTEDRVAYFDTRINSELARR